MRISLLSDGLTVRDPDLVTEAAPLLVFRKGMRKAEVVRLLAQCIGQDDQTSIHQCLKFLGKPPFTSSVLDAVAQALVAHDPQPHLLELLEKHQLIQPSRVRTQMKDQARWGMTTWLLRDRQSIEQTERGQSEPSERMTHDQTVRPCVNTLVRALVMAGGAGKAATLDLPYIYRNIRPGRENDASMLMSLAIRSQASAQDIASFAEALLTPELMKEFYPNQNSEEIENTITRLANPVMRTALVQQDLNELCGKLEDILARSPKLLLAFEKYWDLPWEVIQFEHPGRWSPTDHEKIEENLPGLAKPVHRDLLDCAIRVGADWVHEAVLKKGKLQKRVWEKLNDDKGPLMAGFIQSFHPEHAHEFVAPILNNIHEGWADSQGRGLGHYFVRISNSPTEKFIRAVLRHKNGLDLLSEIDQGIPAANFLEERDGWGSSEHKIKFLEALSLRAKRHALEKISQNNAVEKLPQPKPKF